MKVCAESVLMRHGQGLENNPDKLFIVYLRYKIMALDWSAANILAKNLLLPPILSKNGPPKSAPIHCAIFFIFSPQIFFISPQKAEKIRFFFWSRPKIWAADWSKSKIIEMILWEWCCNFWWTSQPPKLRMKNVIFVGPKTLKFRRVTIRGAQPSARLSEEICLSEGSAGVSPRVLRSAGFCGCPRDFQRFFGGSDPMLVTLANSWRKNHDSQRCDRILHIFLRPKIGQFSPTFWGDFLIRQKPGEKGTKIQSNPLETAPRNGRFLSLVVVGRVLILAPKNLLRISWVLRNGGFWFWSPKEQLILSARSTATSSRASARVSALLASNEAWTASWASHADAPLKEKRAKTRTTQLWRESWRQGQRGGYLREIGSICPLVVLCPKIGHVPFKT